MLKIQSLSIVSIGLMTIAGVIAPNLSASAQDYGKSANIIHPELTKTVTDDSVKPILRPVDRVGNADESIRPMLPKKSNRSGTDDSIRPIKSKLPTIDRSGAADDGLHPNGDGI
jgi:hypothetical protein